MRPEFKNEAVYSGLTFRNVLRQGADADQRNGDMASPTKIDGEKGFVLHRIDNRR